MPERVNLPDQVLMADLVNLPDQLHMPDPVDLSDQVHMTDLATLPDQRSVPDLVNMPDQEHLPCGHTDFAERLLDADLLDSRKRCRSEDLQRIDPDRTSKKGRCTEFFEHPGLEHAILHDHIAAYWSPLDVNRARTSKFDKEELGSTVSQDCCWSCNVDNQMLARWCNGDAKFP